MASHFNQKLIANANRHGHILWRSHENHPHVAVKTLDQRKMVNIKQSQLVTLHKQHATAHIKATGQYSNILTGGSVDIPIREGSGFGHVNNSYLKIGLQNNTGFDSELVSDGSLWINFIEFLTPDGTRVQNLYGKQNLYEMSDTYVSKEWKVKSRLRVGDKNWRKTTFVMVNGEQKDIYIDLIGSFMKAGGIFLPALRGELICRIWFHDDAQTLISGSVPTMTNLELLIESSFMTDNDFRAEMIKYRQNVLDFRYPYPVRQVFTQTMQPDTTYDFVLSGFNGLFTELRFAVQPANDTGNNMKTYYRIQDFEILDQNGTNIIGGSAKTHNQSQYLDYSRHYDNDQNLHLDIYRYPFSFDPASMIKRGQVLGYLPLNGRDQVRIRTGAAEVNKVVTVTRVAGGAPTGLDYRLIYRGYATDLLAFNATPAAIALALEALKPFQDNLTDITVSADLTNDPITIDWGGQEAFEYPDELIYVESLGINDGAVDNYFDSSLTTKHTPGFPSGSVSYAVHFSGVSVHRLESNNGMIKVFSS
jgi:hypothetical protein